MNLNILHHNYGFGIDPIKGVKFVFVTLIDGWGQPICEDYTVPLKPASF